MLSRNNLKDILAFKYIRLDNLKTLSFFANSISTPTNSLEDLTYRLKIIAESCPSLTYLNIDANPLVDAVVLQEQESQNLLEKEEHEVLTTLAINYRRLVKS